MSKASEVVVVEDSSPESPSMVDVGRMIADGIAEGMARLQPKKVTFGEYAARQPKKPKLTRPTTQNGYPISPLTLLPNEIDLLNKLTRSGRYIQRRVEVIVRNEDRELADQTVEIRYSNKTREQMLENARAFGTFEDLLKKIVLEQEVALENDALGRRR